MYIYWGDLLTKFIQFVYQLSEERKGRVYALGAAHVDARDLEQRYRVGARSAREEALIVRNSRCALGQDTLGNGDGSGEACRVLEHIVVIEEVDENEYFHDRRLMISIFMSVINVHANWYPVDGTVKKVAHHNGKFMKAWLPKASTDNERSTVVIETPEGVEVMARQIAGAMARRIVTYAEPGEDCYIDEHMGFIKFGSRVDVYLPLGTEVFVKMGQTTTGNQTVIAKLK